jgi:hypothetical protein
MLHLHLFVQAESIGSPTPFRFMAYVSVVNTRYENCRTFRQQDQMDRGIHRFGGEVKVAQAGDSAPRSPNMLGLSVLLNKDR